MSIKSLFFSILILFFCFDVLSQIPEKPRFNNSALNVIDDAGKELVGELNYKGAITVFNSSKNQTYRASVDEKNYFDYLIKNTQKLEICINAAEIIEDGRDIEKIINKYKECSEIFSTTRIKSIQEKFIKYALEAHTIIDTNINNIALKYISKGDTLRKKGNIIEAIDKYKQVGNLPNVLNYFKQLAINKIAEINRPSLMSSSNDGEPKPITEILTPTVESPPPSKNWNINIYAGAFRGRPVIANNKESLTTRIPLANSEIGIDYTSKVNSIKSVNLFWSLGLGYMQYSFATVDNNQKDIEAFKLNYIKVQGAVKVFITKKGTFQPFIKLEPFALIPIKTEYHNYYNETIDPTSTIARVATIGGTLSIGGEINRKHFRIGLEPFIMMTGNFLKSKPGIQGLQNPSQLKSSLLGYGLRIYIGFGNSQQ